jgi:integrase
MKRFPDHLRLNPFAHIRLKVQPKKGKWRYVSYQETVRASDACTDIKTSRVGWQVLIALCRLGGLRKGEAFALEKRDVDLEQSPPLIKVYASKTARSTGVPSRVVPMLFPLLQQLLVKAIGESRPTESFVVSSLLPRTSGSDHKTLMRILQRAKLVLWKPAFQVLRACFEKDMLGLGMPEADYTKAVGHSPEVSRRFYLAKFEGASLDEAQADRFNAAAQKLQSQLALLADATTSTPSV